MPYFCFQKRSSFFPLLGSYPQKQLRTRKPSNATVCILFFYRDFMLYRYQNSYLTSIKLSTSYSYCNCNFSFLRSDNQKIIFFACQNEAVNHYPVSYTPSSSIFGGTRLKYNLMKAIFFEDS